MAICFFISQGDVVACFLASHLCPSLLKWVWNGEVWRQWKGQGKAKFLFSLHPLVYCFLPFLRVYCFLPFGYSKAPSARFLQLWFLFAGHSRSPLILYPSHSYIWASPHLGRLPFGAGSFVKCPRSTFLQRSCMHSPELTHIILLCEGLITSQADLASSGSARN